MKTVTFVLAATVLVVCLSGCAGLQRPSWLRPGPAPYQQRMAERFDPYPDNQMGPPVQGGRPRDYEISSPEPARARWPVPGVRPSGNATASPALTSPTNGF
jgi:hypothetical protein